MTYSIRVAKSEVFSFNIRTGLYNGRIGVLPKDTSIGSFFTQLELISSSNIICITDKRNCIPNTYV